MTVYVDPLFEATPRTAQARAHGKKWCHMTVGYGDDLEELHRMAESIGLKRKYFQSHAWYPHYDLIPSKRRLAVSKGAVSISNDDRRLLCCRDPHLRKEDAV